MNPAPTLAKDALGGGSPATVVECEIPAGMI
jgi:hypothetical protein